MADILKKAVTAISIAVAISTYSCENEKVTRQIYDYDKDGRNDTVTTWYDSKGTKTKEKIVLLFQEKSEPTTWVDSFDCAGHKAVRTFDNNSDGKLEGRITYDSTGGVIRFERFYADGKPRVYKR